MRDQLHIAEEQCKKADIRVLQLLANNSQLSSKESDLLKELEAVKLGSYLNIIFIMQLLENFSLKNQLAAPPTTSAQFLGTNLLISIKLVQI